MASLTSLANQLLQQLTERASRFYLNQKEKAEYIKSYKAASIDKETLLIAQEGAEDYFSQLKKWDN